MTTNKIKMLILEDNPGDVDLLREMLSEVASTTYELQHADRVETALARLEEEVFDIVVIDLSLPDSSGLETLDTIYARAGTTPVVILSSLSDEALALEAVRKGAQDYLVKGHIDGTILSRVIRYAIEETESADSKVLAEFLHNEAKDINGITGPILGWDEKGDRLGTIHLAYIIDENGEFVVNPQQP